VIGHEDHSRILVEVAALLAPTHELFDKPAGDPDSLDLLGAIGARRVAVLVDGEELEDQKLRVVLL
jgi:hypothetical protein